MLNKKPCFIGPSVEMKSASRACLLQASWVLLLLSNPKTDLLEPCICYIPSRLGGICLGMFTDPFLCYRLKKGAKPQPQTSY